MITGLNQRILKMLFLFFFIWKFNCGLVAQTSVKFLEGPALEKAIHENLQKGLPEYKGINIQYTITIDQLEEASKYSGEIISEIKNVPGFIDINFDIQNKAVIVKCSKENSTEQFPIIKEILSRNNVPAIDHVERMYKN